MLQAAERRQQIKLAFKATKESHIIAINTDMYERILLNLLSNGFKFSHENSKVAVKIEVGRKHVKISVQDRGIGILPDQIDAIFNRFVQLDSSLSRKSEGTGIGLSLVKALVEKMEGILEVKIKEKEGTVFTIRLQTKKLPKEEEAMGRIKSGNELAEIINIKFSNIYS